FTIPTERHGFELVDLPKEQVADGGFISLEELNSLRFSDFSLGHYFKLAEQSAYYDNTIFVVLGDHGLPDRKARHVAAGLKAHGIERFHVPLLIVWKNKIKPQILNEIASEVDVLPTVVSL